MARAAVHKGDLYGAGLPGCVRPDLRGTFRGLLSGRTQAGRNLLLSHAEHIRVSFRTRAAQRATGNRRAAEQKDEENPHR